MSDNNFFAFFDSAKALLFGVARKVKEHDQKVTHTRYCKICGRLADFRIRTGFRDMTPGEMSFHGSSAENPSGNGTSEASLLLAHNPTFRVCQTHHPDLGRSRDETREYLHKINPKLAVRLIEPTQLL